MDTAVIPFQTVFANRLHIIIYKFKINFGIIPKLNGLSQELGETTLFLQSPVDLLPCAVFVGIHFAFAVLRAAALSVDQALGAVHDGADTAGYVQIALRACITALLRQSHAMMSCIIQRITGCEDRLPGQICNRLDTKAAGSHQNMLGPFRNHIL